MRAWVEDIFGPDISSGTLAGTSKERSGMHYDADYEGRDYKNDPVVPPAPRDQ
jgi:hypothetical protein